MSLTNHVAIFVMAHVAAFAGAGLAFMLLSWASFFDVPNERSSHSGPVPRGAGLALTPLAAAAVAGVGLKVEGAAAEAVSIAWIALALGALSWIDDRRGLPAALRLLAHVAAIAYALSVMGASGPFFGGLLPGWLDVATAGFLWLWFVNLFNFMDGIDGITGTETAIIGSGAAVVALTAGTGGGISHIGIALAGLATGFLWWNWRPAKVFLGDVGSVPFGFLLGWLLLLLAARGQWAAALILPLYYLADATITLLRRIVRREPFWRAHRQHFYQRAALGRLGHAGVVLAVLAAGSVLIACAAAAALGWPWPALAGAVVAVAVLLRHLARAAFTTRSRR